MTAGTLHTCGITTAGTTYCWGANDHGEIGVEPRAQCGASRCTLEPTVAAAGLSFVQVAAGASRSCGLTASGRAYCWGLGDLGDAALANQSVAPLLVSTDSTFVQLTTGSFHTCALTRSGAAYCGGLNSHGQIGDGTVTRRPVTVLAGDTLRFRRLAAGGEHTCGVALNNSLHCWGNNQWGQLGIGDVVWNTPGVYRTRPAAVGTTRSWSTVTASYSHTCAITTLREAFCWGDNGNAHVLGDETTVTYRGVPTRVAGGIPFDTLVAGYLTTCGLSGGAPYCWGDNAWGGLGSGDASRYSAGRPALVLRGPFVQITVGGYHACGLTAGGVALCWGDSYYGQTGAGKPPGSYSY